MGWPTGRSITRYTIAGHYNAELDHHEVAHRAVHYLGIPSRGTTTRSWTTMGWPTGRSITRYTIAGHYNAEVDHHGVAHRADHYL